MGGPGDGLRLFLLAGQARGADGHAFRPGLTGPWSAGISLPLDRHHANPLFRSSLSQETLSLSLSLTRSLASPLPWVPCGAQEAPPAPADAALAAGAGAGAASAGIRLDTLHSLLPKESRSHTLVFDQPSAADAKAVVQTLRKSHGIEIDSRKTYVRIGFGFNHNPEEVDRLLRAIGQG